VVWRYERALAEYLRGHFAGRRDGTLRADVIAAAVVAAHNNGLRSWLRSDGESDATAEVDHALTHVQRTFGAGRTPAEAADATDAADAATEEDVVVVISKRGAPMWRVVQEIETTLGRDPG
jgi:hypothetical protein